MTSLALLAHSAAAADPKFNDTFYATVAGVIPVLFLALVAQSAFGPGPYDGLLKSATDAAARLKERYSAPAFAVAMLWPITALLILASGADGELAAIDALARGHGSTFTADAATASVFFLTIAVVAGPAGPLVTALSRLLMIGLRNIWVPDRPAPGGAEQPAAAADPDAPDEKRH